MWYDLWKRSSCQLRNFIVRSRESLWRQCGETTTAAKWRAEFRTVPVWTSDIARNGRPTTAVQQWTNGHRTRGTGEQTSECVRHDMNLSRGAVSRLIVQLGFPTSPFQRSQSKENGICPAIPAVIWHSLPRSSGAQCYQWRDLDHQNSAPESKRPGMRWKHPVPRNQEIKTPPSFGKKGGGVVKTHFDRYSKKGATKIGTVYDTTLERLRAASRRHPGLLTKGCVVSSWYALPHTAAPIRELL